MACRPVGLRIGLAREHLVDGHDRTEPVLEPERGQPVRNPRAVGVGRDPHRDPPVGRCVEQGRHAGPWLEQIQQVTAVATMAFDDTSGVDRAATAGHEQSDQIDGLHRAHERCPGLDREIASVVGERAPSRLVLDVLGVGDRPVEVEHQSAGSHARDAIGRVGGSNLLERRPRRSCQTVVVRIPVGVVVRARRTNTYGLNVVLGALDHAGPPIGWIAEIVEAETELPAAVERALAACDRVLVCWSFYSPDVGTVAAELSAVRRAVSDPDHRVTHLAGGVHTMAEPAATLGLGFDLAATGEGEQILTDVVRALVDGRPLAEVAGLAWLDGTGLLVRTATPARHPLDAFPPFAARRRRYNPIEITRGCIYACRFCQTPYAFKASFRHRSVESVADAVAHLRSRGMRYVRFLTPTALSYGADGSESDLGAVEALLAAARHALGPDGKLYFGTFPSELRPEHVTDEAMRLVGRFCDNRSVQIGAQSGSETVLASSKRGHDVAAVERAVRTAVAHGLRPDVDLLFGLPGETDADARASLALAERLTALGARMHGHTFLPLPGTPYRSAAPGTVSDAVRLDLERLAARGALYGQWARQERVAVTLARPQARPGK